jgi:hypothetical protein
VAGPRGYSAGLPRRLLIGQSSLRGSESYETTKPAFATFNKIPGARVIKHWLTDKHADLLYF